VLDGEIITLDAQGRSVFQWLQSRIGLKGEADIAAAARAHPALYCAFDLLYCDGYDLCHEPLAARKESLTQVVRPAAGLRLSDTVVGDGEQRFRAAERQGLEGIIAKLASSPHEVGRSRY
jgi:bifunctional non-homologous end joining protein LigD